ncbi:hypothetical protein CA85_22090 [Allorhodopirellula solitaria]|uniref:DUF3293 domain-containing protein n=2 Tax=Allorhodopirellula solitaria TaxID=2527987 RepID=A0A5C5XXS0_9BACT|nr:hypothetical protein CA85_22090 [Allorhodopirellula solitaria]
MDLTPKSLWRTYGESLIVDERMERVYAGPHADDLPFRAPCFVITAWNPMSEPTGEADNLARNEELWNRLQDQTDQIRAVVGQSPCGDWKEDSFLVAGLAEQEVLQMATDYQQRAIFRLDDESKFVIDPQGNVRDHGARCQ